jgi:hypothetical protein
VLDIDKRSSGNNPRVFGLVSIVINQRQFIAVVIRSFAEACAIPCPERKFPPVWVRQRPCLGVDYREVRRLAKPGYVRNVGSRGEGLIPSAGCGAGHGRGRGVADGRGGAGGVHIAERDAGDIHFVFARLTGRHSPRAVRKADNCPIRIYEIPSGIAIEDEGAISAIIIRTRYSHSHICPVSSVTPPCLSGILRSHKNMVVRRGGNPVEIMQTCRLLKERGMNRPSTCICSNQNTVIIRRPDTRVATGYPVNTPPCICINRPSGAVEFSYQITRTN